MLKAITADLGFSLEKLLLELKLSLENLSLNSNFIFGKIFDNKGLIVKEPKKLFQIHLLYLIGVL